MNISLNLNNIKNNVMKYISIIFFTFSLFIFNTSKAQIFTKIEGVNFPSKNIINNNAVVLNGGGLREKYGFVDLYVGGLYLKSKTNDANKIIMADEEMGIRIVIVSSLVSREKFIEALEEGFENTTAGEHTKEQIEKFKKCFTDPFVKNDKVVLNYVPGEGVHLLMNGTKKGTIQGLPFKQALFGIWLGGVPASEDLKSGMLGL